jgi:hypothetical protein
MELAEKAMSARHAQALAYAEETVLWVDSLAPTALNRQKALSIKAQYYSIKTNTHRLSKHL